MQIAKETKRNHDEQIEIDTYFFNKLISALKHSTSKEVFIKILTTYWSRKEESHSCWSL